jgi:hypothetical protein
VRRTPWALLLLVCSVHAVPLAPAAHAQTRAGQLPAGQPRDRFEVSVGGLWIGGAELGSTQADLRANNLSPTPYRLFAAETDAVAAPGLDGRVAYWLTRSLALEGGFVRVRPELRTRITADVEAAGDLTATERIDQYFIDANVLWLLDRFRFGATTPFVSAGAGYLRQLHEGRTFVETGQVYEFGGGVRHPLLTEAGWLRTVGLRLHARLYVLSNGVQLEDRARTHGAFSGAIYFSF